MSLKYSYLACDVACDVLCAILCAMVHGCDVRHALDMLRKHSRVMVFATWRAITFVTVCGAFCVTCRVTRCLTRFGACCVICYVT